MDQQYACELPFISANYLWQVVVGYYLLIAACWKTCELWCAFCDWAEVRLVRFVNAKWRK